MLAEIFCNLKAFFIQLSNDILCVAVDYKNVCCYLYSYALFVYVTHYDMFFKFKMKAPHNTSQILDSPTFHLTPFCDKLSSPLMLADSVIL